VRTVEVLWVVTYEVLLEDLTKYSAITAATTTAATKSGAAHHELTPEELAKAAATIAEDGAKTQYHIKQRLLLSVTQTVATSAYALTRLALLSRELWSDPTFLSLRSTVVAVLPLLVQLGGYEVSELLYM
jgi:hypothetical protein